MGLRSVASSALARLCFGAKASEAQYGRPVRWAEAGNAVIAETLATGEPCMVTRLGSSELGVLSYFVRWRSGAVKFPYPTAVRRAITVNAGFFPSDDRAIDAFAAMYLEVLRDADVLGVWFNPGELAIVRDYCANAQLIELTSLIGMLYDAPWSSQLAGKRLLVVHPFAETIRSQYTWNRKRLFADARVLPEFELQTITPPQTIGDNTCDFATWFDALADTRERISALSYDVALIGAGAYGLPLAAFVKEQGQQAVHVGGATQLFFGIKGRRWEVESEDVVALFNEYWVRPSAQEKPPGAKQIEGGCYW
ncbi:MAG: hypothetical protein WCJ13_06360 [Coriobacteriia bacterium]